MADQPSVRKVSLLAQIRDQVKRQRPSLRDIRCPSCNHLLHRVATDRMLANYRCPECKTDFDLIIEGEQQAMLCDGLHVRTGYAKESTGS